MAKDEATNLEQELNEALSEVSSPPAETPPDAPPADPATESTEETPADNGPPELVKRKWESLEPEQPESSEEKTTELLARLKSEYNADLGDKYADDDELLRGLLNASSLVGRRDADAAAWKQFSQNPDAYLQQWGYTKAQQQQQQQPQQQQPQLDQAPEFDESWYQQVQTDPTTGEIIGVKPGYDPAIPGKLRAAEQWAKRTQQKLLFHPEEVLQPIIDKKVETIRGELEKRLAEEVADKAVEQEAWNWINSDQNRQWLFRNGNPQAGLSDQGLKFKQYVEEAQAEGIPASNVNLLVQKATEKMELDWYRSQNPRQRQPQAPPTAMSGTTVAPQGEERDLDIQENESLNAALRRITGV